MGAARSGWSMLHQSAFLLALRNASPGTECASRTSVPHFLVDGPFAVVWLYFSWLPRWRDSFRALGGSLFGVPSTDRGSRLRDMSNFCCLPGRAGGTPLLVSTTKLGPRTSAEKPHSASKMGQHCALSATVAEVLRLQRHREPFTADSVNQVSPGNIYPNAGRWCCRT
jgi:hypothetical protein